MKSVAFKAFPRTLERRGGVKKLRTAGRIPAVIYGRAKEPQNIEVDSKAMQDLVHHSASENVLVDLELAGDQRPKRLALVQEVQHHALSGKMLHVDFHEVAADEKVNVFVPVETTGEANGVKNSGGVLEHVLFKVKVRGLPKDLPEVIILDVSHLEIGQAIHIGDIKPPAGVEVLGGKNVSVVAVAAPITEAQEAAAAEAAAAATGEVEMIKEKKEDGTEGEAPAGKAAPAAKAGDKAAAAPAAKAGEKAAEKPAEKKAEKKK